MLIEFANAGSEFPLSNVQITVRFPKSSGLTFADGQGGSEVIETFQGVQQAVERCTKTIAEVAARSIGWLDFTVVSDGKVTGDLPYTVTVAPVPGPNTVVSGVITQSATPSLLIRSNANLVSAPWTFSDSAWTSVLGLSSTEFSAYTWDADLQGYVPSTSAVRAQGAWIISPVDYGVHALASSPVAPTDINEGFHVMQLKPGWNLIGNPYPFPIQLGQIVGVTGANPNRSYTFEELVNVNAISGFAAYWENATQTYKFISGGTAVMQPNVGYWMYVPTVQEFTIKFPPVYAEFVPGITVRASDGWTGSNGKWRLNLAARSKASIDDQNYVGVVSTANEANSLRVYKPPMAPTQDVELSIKDSVSGKPMSMAQSYATGTGRHEWSIFVRSVGGGSTTLTWPNLGSTSKNLRFRLLDVATGSLRDMRQVSGYTFNAAPDSQREFRVQVETGNTSKVVIGDVVVSRPTRGAGSTVSISYALSVDAVTTVRILGATGREIYSVTQGRADRAGSNNVAWALRDNANRAVAPGVYRVEILAETSAGDRVRKIVPVTVIR